MIEYSGHIPEKRFSGSYTPSSTAKAAFFYIQTLGHFECDSDYYTKRKGYDSFLMLFTLKGSGVLKYRNSTYEARKNSILLIDCLDYQEYETGDGGYWEFDYIHFNGTSGRDYYRLIYENCGPVMPENTAIGNFISNIFELAMSSEGMQFEIRASELIVRILTQLLLSGTCDLSGYRNPEMNGIVESALEFIDKNYTKGIRLKDIADHCGLSRYHFCRVFKSVTGYSPYEYVIKKRINRAKQMLGESNDSVESIAHEVGFGSTSSFIGTFARMEGLTPLKYRRFWA